MENKNKRWTPQEIRILRTRYKYGMSDEDIAAELKRPTNAITQRRHALGLMRTPQRSRRVELSKQSTPKPRKTIRILWGALEIEKY
jgi:hypothetical protein